MIFNLKKKTYKNVWENRKEATTYFLPFFTGTIIIIITNSNITFIEIIK